LLDATLYPIVRAIGSYGSRTRDHCEIHDGMVR